MSSVWVMGKEEASYPEPAPEVARGNVRRVTVVGEDVLHRRCLPVSADGEYAFGSPELSALIDDMFTTMYVAEGVGLAANQVDVDLQLFVYDCTDEKGLRSVGHICNPELVELPASERRLVEGDEGCLSVPGPYAPVHRPDRAIVRGQDKEGNELTVEGSGYFARCLQHETDHLYGRLYVDRLSRRDQKQVLKEMDSMREKIFEKRARRAEALHV
jgi:peptide deformylase